MSNTIDLWDAVPKYCNGRRKQARLRINGYLPTTQQDFLFKGKCFTVKIQPARVTVKGKEIEYYPTAREGLVEDALRKLACEPGNGYYDNVRSGVCFTLYQLRKELKKTGHTLSYYEVVEALDILSGSKVIISPTDGKALHKTSPLTS